jgi:hypothetical protein
VRTRIDLAEKLDLTLQGIRIARLDEGQTPTQLALL